MKKSIIFVLLTILWGFIIFTFSHMPSKDSISNSKTLINNALTSIYKVTNKEIDENEINNIAKKINVPFRKTMHFLEYLILTVFIIYTLKYLNVSKRDIALAAILLCFSLATMDEIHQLLIGRTGRFLDVLIDTSGGLIPCIIYKIKNK